MASIKNSFLCEESNGIHMKIPVYKEPKKETFPKYDMPTQKSCIKTVKKVRFLDTSTRTEENVSSKAELLSHRVKAEPSRHDVSQDNVRCTLVKEENRNNKMYKERVKDPRNENVNSSDKDHDYDMLTSRMQTSPLYQERMAETTRGDIAHRLDYTDSVTRDVELQDMIDKSLTHTAAALEHANARYGSCTAPRVEERDQGLVSYYQARIIILMRVKDLLTSTMARLQIVKDRDVVKIRKKYEKRTVLCRALGQDSDMAEVAHDKLFDAEREMCKLEQCIQSQNVEINKLEHCIQCNNVDICKYEQSIQSKNIKIEDQKYVLKEIKGRLIECEKQSSLKEQEIHRLQDLLKTCLSKRRHSIEDARGSHYQQSLYIDNSKEYHSQYRSRGDHEQDNVEHRSSVPYDSDKSNQKCKLHIYLH